MAGDVNAHHPSWDPFKDSTATGRLLDEWASDAGMVVLNNGLATRWDLTTASPSAPDVSWVGAGEADRCRWSVLEDIGTDHMPVLTVIRLGQSSSKTPSKRPPTAWNTRKADWTLYGAMAADLGMLGHAPVPSTRQLSRALALGLEEAAKATVPRGARKRAKPWWTEEAEAAVVAARTAKRIWTNNPTDVRKEEARPGRQLTK